MERTVDYYLSKGFDPRTAQYFAAGRKRVVSVAPNPDFTLTLLFDNGETRLYDVRPLLNPGTVFAPLSDPDIFCRAYVDAQHCVAWDIDPNIDSETVWNNKIDLSPDTCYLDSIPAGRIPH